ncbi:MAG: 4Fe-4S binding protein [Eubacteriales bacterium]
MKKSKNINLLGPVAFVYGAANTGSWRIVRPKVNMEECIKCGTCEKYCPTDVITIKKDQANCVEIDFNFCKGCGICANECPKKCIVMVPEGSEENGL